MSPTTLWLSSHETIAGHCQVAPHLLWHHLFSVDKYPVATAPEKCSTIPRQRPTTCSWPSQPGVILLSIVAIVASVIVWAALVVRKALIVVSAVFAPLAFAGPEASAGLRHGCRKRRTASTRRLSSAQSARPSFIKMLVVYLAMALSLR